METQPQLDPATEALASALPFVRSTQRIGWLQIIGAVIACAALAIWLFSLGEDGTSMGIFAVFGAVFIPFAIAGHVRKKHEREILPIVSRAFGLTHTKSPGDFFNSLPDVFIPKGGRRSADDQMGGEVAGRRFTFTEVKTETGGKNSRTLFKGVVIEIANTRNLPPFVIASTKETKGFLFFRGNVHVEGMEQTHGSTGPDGAYYGLWSPPGQGTAQMQGLQAFLNRMLDVGPEVLGQSKLYSVASTSGSILVAITHGEDLFRVGGLLADEQQVMRDVRTAAAEFSHPIKLVTEVLRAEDALIAAQKVTP